MKSAETRRQFIELRAQGLSFSKISETIGVSKQSLVDWAKVFSTLIANLKMIEQEELLEKYYALKSKRVELFGQRLNAVKDELDKRSLENVPTAELHELLFRFTKAIKDEGLELCFKEDVDVGLEALMPLSVTKKWTPA